MGKVVWFRRSADRRVPFQPLAVFRPEHARISLERSLVKVFSSLASAGLPEMALDALVRWGDGRGQAGDLLDNVQSLAAVSGVRLAWAAEESGLGDWYPS